MDAETRKQVNEDRLDILHKMSDLQEAIYFIEKFDNDSREYICSVIRERIDQLKVQHDLLSQIVFPVVPKK